jgi:UDP-N-acetylmuramoyl-tripeptide--D-alanyl-D-alanine ligase
MQIEKLYALFLKHPKIATDTRKDLKGSIFFCLSGENFNGNQFASQALDQGAAYVIVDDKSYFKDNSSYLFVKNSLAILQQLASYHRKQFTIPVIGITGTNGKTTTKELSTAVLSKKFTITATQGNFNNHIGVPLTLLQINRQTEIAVIEMGANHPDEIELLCKIARPNLGIITNIGKAHLEGFGSLEVIKNTKLALYKSVKVQMGKVFVNYDDDVLNAEAQNIAHSSYGQDNTFDIHGTITHEFPFLELKWGIKNRSANYPIQSQLFGNYNFSNILATIALGHHFGLSSEKISTAIDEYRPQNNRSQFIVGKRNELILDAYNANPESLKVALDNFSKDSHKNKVIILGDMFELGVFATEEHKTILESVNNKPFYQNIFIGPLFKQFEADYPEYYFYENTTALITQIESLNIKQCRVLIKGSRGIKLEVLQDYLI